MYQLATGSGVRQMYVRIIKVIVLETPMLPESTPRSSGDLPLGEKQNLQMKKELSFLGGCYILL
jgi:hypothetical protein